ncbi:MAG: helix-turn-helix transcriptional regulator, partial [Waterburya sp.]
LGKGQFWEIDLCSESWLLGETWQKPRDHAYISQEREHEVEFCLWIPDQNSNNRHSRYTFFGSGIAPQEIWQSPVNSPGFYVAISFEPDLLKTLYGNAAGELPPELKLLIKDNDWQKCWRDRTINSTMMAIVRDILACPYQGLTKQIYLQGKTLELLAVQIELLKRDGCVETSNYHFKKKTIDGIYQARDLLLKNWENPPAIVELAKLVGMSDRTLRRGFRQIFGTTVIGYLINYRLEQAQQMLRDRHLTVAQVSRLVGYSSPSRFAIAFKQKFGICPRECFKGKKL